MPDGTFLKSFILTTDHNSRELVNRRSLCSQYKTIFTTFLTILSHFLFFTKKANYSFFICCFLPSDAIFNTGVVFMLHVQLIAVSWESGIAAPIPLRALSVPGEWCKQIFCDPRSVICQTQGQTLANKCSIKHVYVYVSFKEWKTLKVFEGVFTILQIS